MARITPKENLLKMAGGGHPEYVPYFTWSGNELEKDIPVKGASPGIYVTNPPNPDGSVTSPWGVTTYPNQDTAGSAMPAPNWWMLDDITKWRDVIKKPAIRDDLDFEAMYKADMERIGINREETALRSSISFGPWGSLFNFMGFEGALCAMAEEPEYVKELFDWMASISEPYIEKVLDAYKPDIWNMGDDSCTERAPFFSVAMYKELYKPIYTRFAKKAMERGIPIIFHICGNCEPFISDMIDFGVKYIEPAQETIDIMASKEKYKGKMSFVGAYDWGKHLPANYPNYDPEEVKADIRASMDMYSPGGAYAPLIWPVSYVGDPHIDELKKLCWEYAAEYGKTLYGYTGD